MGMGGISSDDSMGGSWVMSDRTLGLHVRARSGPGILHQLSGVIARHQGDITSVEIAERTPDESRVYFEVVLPGASDALVSELRALDPVLALELVETFQRVYGKRIIIMGGGAQVGQVAIGAMLTFLGGLLTLMRELLVATRALRIGPA
jgi:energy-converting hydrogenase B subunit Q